MDSILSVVTPAADLSLLTTAELRAAVGVTNGSQDEALQALGSRVYDRITHACQVSADGATPPTLLQESLSETFRVDDIQRLNVWDWRSRPRELVLARRPIVSVSLVTENGVTLVEGTDFEVFPGAGMLRRLFDGQVGRWAFGLLGTVVAQYVAGFQTAPYGLKLAAERLAREYWFSQTRDPAVRQISIPGVIERQYWIGSKSDPDVPQYIMDMLGPYTNRVIG